ncbi:MAG: hypothetical protein V3R86_04105 [Candidatus Hydrothermarchaeaceae archaeon]
MRRVQALIIFLIFVNWVAAQENAVFPVSIETDLLNPEITRGEIRNYSILLIPTTGRVNNLKLYTFGQVSQFITFEKTQLSLDFGETQEIKIELDSGGAKTGIYTGKLILDANGRTREIPVKISVIEKDAKIDVTMEVKTREVKLSEPIKFLVTIYNVGQKESFNLHLTHKLKDVAGEVISVQEEDAVLVTSLSLDRTFFSEGLPLKGDTYYVETVVTYEGKNETSVGPFKLLEPFWTAGKIAILFFIIVIISFVAGFSFYK